LLPPPRPRDLLCQKAWRIVAEVGPEASGRFASRPRRRYRSKDVGRGSQQLRRGRLGGIALLAVSVAVAELHPSPDGICCGAPPPRLVFEAAAAAAAAQCLRVLKKAL